MKYIDAEKLKAEIERHKQGVAIARFDNAGENADYFQGKVDLCDDLTHIITSLQQEQPDFDDVDPKHLVHSHYTKVREIETGRVFWAEYSSEAAEWYEAVTGRAYSSSDVEIVKEQPKVDLEKEYKTWWNSISGKINVEHIMEWYIHETARHFYELGLNAKKADR